VKNPIQLSFPCEGEFADRSQKESTTPIWKRCTILSRECSGSMVNQNQQVHYYWIVIDVEGYVRQIDILTDVRFV
jgi:hypothetical protein